MERRNFGIADDVYAAGLLLAYMAFMPFCQPGSIDAPSLQRCADICLAHCSACALWNAWECSAAQWKSCQIVQLFQQGSGPRRGFQR